VIEAMIKGKNPNNATINRIYKRIRLNLKGFRNGKLQTCSERT